MLSYIRRLVMTSRISTQRLRDPWVFDGTYRFSLFSVGFLFVELLYFADRAKLKEEVPQQKRIPRLLCYKP